MTERASLSRLLAVFLRIGNLTFGGGDPTIVALQRELVERRGWLDPDRYAIVFALARVTPGTNMLAFIVAAAWSIAGWTAAAGAVLAVTVPSAVLVLWLTYAYERWSSNATVMSVVSATLAAAVGMMFAGTWLLIQPHVAQVGNGARRLRTIAIFSGSLVLLWLNIPPVGVLALAAAAGLLWRTGEETS